MKWPIGFNTFPQEDRDPVACQPEAAVKPNPRKSIVNVHFPARNMTLPYYNDQFDLHRGDLVFVDGKLEGLRGRVVDVTYNFKIKLSDYKRVIAVADTKVSGEFFLAGSHFVSFDKDAVPFEKVITWFRAPLKPEDEFVSSFDEQGFSLERLEDMGVRGSVAERGGSYYRENKVLYLSVDSEGCGRAIVEGSKYYVVEFHYDRGSISALTCSCYCSDSCKHEFAAMLQLKETLEIIMKHYKARYEEREFFAAMSKYVFMTYAVDGMETGALRLESTENACYG